MLRAYAYRYDLDLFSNFTYFLDDPVHGDQFEQSDSRTVTGAGVSHEWVAPRAGGGRSQTSVGLQVRYDDIDNGLFHTEARERLATTREDQHRASSAAVPTSRRGCAGRLAAHDRGAPGRRLPRRRRRAT